MKYLSFIREWIYAIPISKPIQETILELLRIGIFAGISAIVAYAINYLTMIPSTETTIFLTFVLRAVDKWLYEKQGEIKKMTSEKHYGLLGV